ncbi:hypothetical protein FUAX_30650 [Fulvitalea axinellae]|uniref:Phage abortive infection protein n=1 Tax=Fulvitalea axinellae TaxID=1182444 RepID=A0AAU9CKD1_9BACT|nr:hypothetical protein FUAX_30650 [Fulvitalea axinellae]
MNDETENSKKGIYALFLRLLKSINWKYALGETLIVVIGITIAFNVDTGYENFKQQRQRKIILRQMLNDLKEDEKEIQKLISATEMTVKNCQTILEFDIKKTTGSKKEINALVNSLFGLVNKPTLRTNDVGYQAFISKTQLRDHQTDSLNILLNQYYQTAYGEINHFEREYEEHRKLKITPYFFENLNFTNPTDIDLNSLTNKYFRNITSYTAIILESGKTKLTSALKTNRKLKTQIRKSI